jgi:hypothetical protein
VRPANTLPIIALGLLTSIIPTRVAAQPVDDQASRRFIDFTAGMGVDLHSASSIVNYVNLVGQPRPEEKLYDFSSAVEFYAVPEIQVSQKWSVGLEYSLLIKSYSIDDRTGFSRSEFSYQVHMPTLLVHRLVFGDGYRVKLGGGIGYHFANFTQRFQSFGGEEVLSAEGIAVKLDAIGNTKFDETFYGSIGVDLRWDVEGPLGRRQGVAPAVSNSIQLPKMNFFSAGLKFGVTFQFN